MIEEDETPIELPWRERWTLYAIGGALAIGGLLFINWWPGFSIRLVERLLG